MKIYYREDNNKFIGTENIDKSKIEEGVNNLCVEIKQEEWLKFLNNNQGKEFFVIDKKLIAKEFIKDFFEEKNKKLKLVSSTCTKYFLSIYPEYKQRNIAIFGTDEEKLKFKEFHKVTTAKYDNYIEQINNIEEKYNNDKTKSCTYLKELNNINIDFNN